ncbi:hypothetical protein [Chelatococcus reniformis]|uniref:Polymerase nucleotidyl transferase domain-containing protein n=1 Tax=Chelatococcus reniformis TaxID=1494448 RepID=A0A916TYG2_9HYPH|nr:hypothetical protein [Chelatococcus reniformis]GGC48937.1 hypothetical protein GCM10010994_05130 [Chelatococcus reniformis]
MRFQDVIKGVRERSESQLESLRKVAASELGDRSDLIVGVNGSLARRELTSGSDIDLFFLTTNGDIESAAAAQRSYRSALEAVGVKMPAEGGVFENPLPIADLVKVIGGSKDTNELITRRMLFLLEGEWIVNEVEFRCIRERLIDRYVEEDLDEHKICLFLLNDIIRYWRTICVDYENKVQGGKPKAIRLIKLRFSRMMLYFGGVVAVEGTGELTTAHKRATLVSRLSLSPIQRIQNRFGRRADAALTIYAEFLEKIDSVSTRRALDQPGDVGLNSDEFKFLSNKARLFKDELAKLILDDFGSSNPVVRAILL